MDRPHLNPSKSLTATKDKKFKTEIQIVQKAFFETPSSMRELEVRTNILRPHICRFIAMMRETGTIQAIKKGRCSITGRIVGIYSTNPNLFLPNPQTKLDFEGGSNAV